MITAAVAAAAAAAAGVTAAAAVGWWRCAVNKRKLKNDKPQKSEKWKILKKSCSQYMNMHTSSS